MEILKIGKTAGYKLRQDFYMEVKQMSEENQYIAKELIASLDPSA